MSKSAPRNRRCPRAVNPVTCGADAPPAQAGQHDAAEARTAITLSRRTVLSAAFATAATPLTGLPAEAVQGYTAGRLPGTSQVLHITACADDSHQLHIFL